MSAHEAIARNLRALRAARRWSVRQLAEECAKRGATTLTQASLTNIERGLNSAPSRSQRRVTVDELVFLADLFGVTPTDLFAQRDVCDRCDGAGYLRVATEDSVSTGTAEVASLAAQIKWAGLTPSERAAATAPARESFDQRWDRLVDPEGKLDPAVRAERAAEAKRAHYAELALKSAEVRRAKAVTKGVYR